jgi:hypothetical protein
LVVYLDETPLVAVTGRALLLAVTAGRNDAEATVAGTARARITAPMSATSCTPRPATTWPPITAPVAIPAFAAEAPRLVAVALYVLRSEQAA